MSKLILNVPIQGEIVPLSNIKDPAFSSGALGEGIAIIPSGNQVISPCAGEITVLFETLHAIGIHTSEGADILIHIGLNTVNLGGKHFKSYVEQGSKVTPGQLLLEFDRQALIDEGYDISTPVVVTNSQEFNEIIFKDKDTTTIVKATKEELVNDKIIEPVVEDNLSKEAAVAKQILAKVGGKDNVKIAEHCATRLRLILADENKLDAKAVENIDGVKGQYFAAGQYQIILGTGFVNKVHGEFIKLIGESQGDMKEHLYQNMSLTQKISRTLGDIFVPIIPVLVATGLFMGIRGSLMSLGVSMDNNLLMLSQILTDTAFAFLPALVTWSVVKRFGGTPVIGIVLGLMLVAPQLPNAYAIASGDASPIMLQLFGLSIPLVGYQGTVLPALILGIFAAKLEQKLKTIVPDVIDLIVTPFLVLLISMIVGIIILGPVLHTVELGIFSVVKNFLNLPYGIGGFIVGGLQQIIVVSGVHHVFSALEIELLSSTGHNMFNAIITGAIIAQGGAGLAVALKVREKKKRAMFISSVIPAFLGITEPVIFGINLRLVKPFIFGLIGGACAGGVAAYLHLAGTGMGITVLPGILLYMNNLGEYLLVNLIGFGVAFALTFSLYKVSLEEL